MTTQTIAAILFDHSGSGYLFGPDRLISVTCKCGAITAADDYESGYAHYAAIEVHARHQADVIGAELEDAWDLGVMAFGVETGQSMSDDAIRTLRFNPHRQGK